MSGFFGNMTDRDVISAASSLGATLTAYEDRQRKMKREDEADKRVAAQERRAQESHEANMAAQERTKNLEKMKSNLALAMSAKNSGNMDTATKYLSEAYSIYPDGKDMIQVKDLNKVSDEDLQDFIARNPEMKTFANDRLVAQVYDGREDRTTLIGAKNFDSVYRQLVAAATPEEFIRQEATNAAYVDSIQREAKPTVTLDETGEPIYTLPWAVRTKDGKIERQVKTLTEEEALKRDPSIKGTFNKLKSEATKMGLATRKTEAEINKLIAETNKLNNSAKKSMTITEQAKLSDGFEKWVFQEGKKSNLAPQESQALFTGASHYLMAAYGKTGDMNKAFPLAVQMYESAKRIGVPDSVYTGKGDIKKAGQGATGTASTTGKGVAVPATQEVADATKPLQVISKYESSNNYDVYNKGGSGEKNIIPGDSDTKITNMTVGEVMSRQSLKKNDDGKMFAVGAYQFTPNFLKEAIKSGVISEEDALTPDIQDTLAVWGIAEKRKGQPSGKFVNGKSDDIKAAIKDIRKEWIGLNKASDKEVESLLLGVRDIVTGGDTPMRPLITDADVEKMVVTAANLKKPTKPTKPTGKGATPAKRREYFNKLEQYRDDLEEYQTRRDNAIRKYKQGLGATFAEEEAVSPLTQRLTRPSAQGAMRPLFR